jgi:hypothetical protein
MLYVRGQFMVYKTFLVIKVKDKFALGVTDMHGKTRKKKWIKGSFSSVLDYVAWFGSSMGGGVELLDVRIFVLGNRWKRMVSFKPQLLYCIRTNSSTYFRVGCMGANSRTGRSAENCNLCTCRDLNPVSRLSWPNCSQYADSTFKIILKWILN